MAEGFGALGTSSRSGAIASMIVYEYHVGLHPVRSVVA
jgi:hypothetical protein